MRKAIKPRVKSPVKSFEIGEKRLYLPGCKIEATCPFCGEVITKDLSRNYLSYPTANKPFTETMYHESPEGRDHEFSIRLVLGVSLSIAETRTPAGPT